MIKIDASDIKILYELDFNSRQSLTQIGKNVGLKKDLVSYRINKLMQEGIIKNFYTYIDSYRLGYIIFKYYINFRYVTSDVRRKIIEYFSNYLNIATVGIVPGKYDLIITVWVRDISEFYQFWKKSLDDFGDFFESKIFSVFIKGAGFRQSYLLSKANNYEERNVFVNFGMGEKVEIDKLDFQILKEIVLDARISLFKLAEKLNISSQKLNYRLNKMIKNGIIQAFRVNIDVLKLNMHKFTVDIYLKKHKQRREIIKYIQQNPNLLFIYTSSGIYDLEIEVILENSECLIQIMEEINKKFPNSIRNYNFFSDCNLIKEMILPSLFE